MNGLMLQRLRDAHAATESISDFLSGASFQEYQSSYGLRLQIERLLEIVGEALNQARFFDTHGELQVAIPELGEIIGLRNRIIHGYNRVDDEMIWAIASANVPILRNQLVTLIDYSS